MSSIDEVIARSREPGEFTERREFSVARGQAIEKLRKFALVDPHYYILELIQSAVANGATYIDIKCDKSAMVISYIGGSFTENSLARLFDFLFAAEDDVEHGPLRQLALGVNALMQFDPDEIVVETGNGTLAGTSRIVIQGEADTVQVGRPDKPLEGTFVRASGMERDEKPGEYRAVEERCLVAPVPILFNQQPVFGYSSQRTPKSLYGFNKTITFDEGDLYGTIGVARRHSGAVFRLLTHGVWIESTRRVFPDARGEEVTNLGGVVTFDRLRKTADHSSIVEDERYEEMWVRLRPYVNKLIAGDTASSGYEVTTLAGQPLEGRELIDVLRDSDAVVLVPRRVAGGGPHYDAARKIGESLGVAVLCVPPENQEAIKTLGGRDVEFVVPDFSDDRELQFYTGGEEPLPARPWLTAPVDLGRMALVDLVEQLPVTPDVPSMRTRLSDHSQLADVSMAALRKIAWLLGNPPGAESIVDWKQQNIDPLGDNVHATVYTPEDRSADKRGINVEVRTAQRIVWQGSLEAVAPGQVLVVDVSAIAPRRLWDPPEDTDKPVARLIAEAVTQAHLSELEEAADRGLRAALRADVNPNTNAAQLVLASLNHRLVKRIRSTGDDRRIRFSIVDAELDPEILELPLLRAIDGAGVSMRDLEELMHRCHGLVYAVRTDITPELEGLDEGRILVVDDVLEDLLISLVGPTAYVRVDNRDVIAEYQGVKCRDIAVGLRDYPDFPLLVEGADPTEFDERRRDKCIDRLVARLVEIIKTEGDDFDSQDLRRQAWRHLQWFATHRHAYECNEQTGEMVNELPLFALANRQTCSYSSLKALIEQRGHVEMLDGWAVGASEWRFEEAIDRMTHFDDAERAAPRYGELTMNPFVLHLLGDFACGAAEYHLSEKELEAVDEPDVGPEVMLEQTVVDNGRAHGIIGVPAQPDDQPAVMVFTGETREAILRDDIGNTFGVVGKIRLRQGVTHDDVADKITQTARDVLSHLLARLPRLASEGANQEYERALQVLLQFAGGRVQLVARRDHSVESNVRDVLAREILNAPLFPGRQGTPVSAMTLYYDFQNRAGSALARGESLEYRPSMLGEDIPEVLDQWIRRHLRIDRIHRPARQPPARAPEPEEHDTSDNDPTLQCAVTTLEHWINALHPDTDVGSDAPLHIEVVAGEETFTEALEDEFCQLRRSGTEPGRMTLLVNPDHWMIDWMVRDGEESSRAVAWPVLAAYAHINEMLDVVTSEHELICQQYVADALDDDRLRLIRS